MVLETIVGYDAANGGVCLAIAGMPSLTVKGSSSEKAYIVGYWLDGISVQRAVVTNPQNSKWDPTGLILYPTSDGTAVGAGKMWRSLKHKIPVMGGDVLVITGVSGNNPMYAAVLVDYPPYTFRMRPEGPSEEGIMYSRTTVAGGTNCAAGTAVAGATDLGAFIEKTLTPVSIHAGAAFTTTAFLGIRKAGDGHITIWPIGLTDVANDWDDFELPYGLFTITKGDNINIWWISETAEQPTARIDFVFTPAG